MTDKDVNFDVRATTEDEKREIGKLLKSSRFMWICPTREVLTIFYNEFQHSKMDELKKNILKIKTVKEIKNDK